MRRPSDHQRFLQLREQDHAAHGRPGGGREQPVIAARVHSRDGGRGEAPDPVGLEPFAAPGQFQVAADGLIEYAHAGPPLPFEHGPRVGYNESHWRRYERWTSHYAARRTGTGGRAIRHFSGSIRGRSWSFARCRRGGHRPSGRRRSGGAAAVPGRLERRHGSLVQRREAGHGQGQRRRRDSAHSSKRPGLPCAVAPAEAGGGRRPDGHHPAAADRQNAHRRKLHSGSTCSSSSTTPMSPAGCKWCPS